MKASFALDFSIDGIAPEDSAPPPHSILEGSPRFRSWEIEAQAGGLYAGVWEATPGKWRIEYDEWEYCRILSGVSVVTEDGHSPRCIATGDSLIMRPGFKGSWEVVETTIKEYVIRL